MLTCATISPYINLISIIFNKARNSQGLVELAELMSELLILSSAKIKRRDFC